MLTVRLLLLLMASFAHQNLPIEKAPGPELDPLALLPKVTHKVFLDVAIDENHEGRVELGLFGESSKLEVKNFVQLCSCGMIGERSNKPICLKNTTVSRIIPDFIIQGGDTAGSLFEMDDSRADADGAAAKFNRKFLLASAGGSAFFITTTKAEWLDGHHVVFGMVLEGEDVVLSIEQEGTYSGTPKKSVRITNSGILQLMDEDKEPFPVARKGL